MNARVKFARPHRDRVLICLPALAPSKWVISASPRSDVLLDRGPLDSSRYRVERTTQEAGEDTADSCGAGDLGENGHGALLAVSICDAAAGDTATLAETLVAATENLAAARDDGRVSDKLEEDYVREVVADKGYHSRQTLADLGEMNLRSYASEPDRGRQNWKKYAETQEAVYANRRRIKGERGKRLLRRRGEFLERSFAHCHCYESSGMCRLHLRGRENIAKRALIHARGGQPGGADAGVLERLGVGYGSLSGLSGFGCEDAIPPLAAGAATTRVPKPHGGKPAARGGC